MSFNLINQISVEDKKKIENYISLYGTVNNFIGLDAWLKHWSDNKIKMYKLLGNQLIYKTPFEYNKSEADLRFQINNLLEKDSSFRCDIFNWYHLHEDAFPDESKSHIRYFLQDCLNSHFIVRDCLDRTALKFKLEDAKRTFQIQKGAKPLRALGKFLTYCENIEGVEDLKREYEDFRIAHSMILNDKTIRGTLAISIHPLDFMTMSDNNSSWSSCMSWINEGCYHVGTVEMMNSNNVLCCYIENSEPFYFSEKENNKKEEYRWANKKWRQLVYFTKDIIVGGKPYPYENDNITKAVIEIIHGLAKENLKWDYSFGPELYQDMKYINSNFSMNRAKRFISNKDTKKYNIIFDTKGMYNDMLNDNNTHYWCVRNKVKHTKVISYSGKSPCLCCGKSVIEENEDSDYDFSDYNERYSDTGNVICYDCLTKVPRCAICGDKDPKKKHHKILNSEGSTIIICDDCESEYIRECPDCKKKMFNLYYHPYNSSLPERTREYIKLSEDYDSGEVFERFRGDKEKFNSIFETIAPICRCKECSEKDSTHFELKEVIQERMWWRQKETVLLSNNKQNKKDWEKYFPYNLKKVEINDGDIVVM